ncbi:MAG TPA: lipase maturation factor family protein [Acidimicrobiia bacterium]|nr:lipase maturation factor family protein [Acidimicrobiia bacterium]
MTDLAQFLSAPDYEFGRQVLQRGIASVYFLAFLNVRNQFRPLLGESGLLPVPGFLERTGFGASPSLFHWRYSDRLALGVGWMGMILAAGIVGGGLDVVPVWVGVLWWLVLWALYLSVVNVGQTFYGFGWESLLLEAGFLAAFLGNGAVAPPLLVILAFRWLLFRVEFGAGMIKLRGDRCWRDLTCLDYHHETQPMPGPTSPWFHHRPASIHRVEVLANHFSQLVVPFALFLPQPVAGVAAVIVVVTQGYLMISGNYAWLNLLTLLLAFGAIPDSWLPGLDRPDSALPSPSLTVVTIALAVVVLWLSRHPVRNLFGRAQRMNYAFNRLHLVNAYGAFGSVTRRRQELILEARPGPAGTDWRPYEFKGKPGDPRRRPPQSAPYHLRLDWVMWFVPLSPAYGRGWLDALVTRLLEADPAVLGLLREDPMQGEPPAAIRGRLVDYRFSTPGERRSTGAWWVRGESRLLFGPVTLTGGP